MRPIFKNLGKVRPTTEGIWNNKRFYTVLSIVYSIEYNMSFISKKDVPGGIDLYNDEYWQPFTVTDSNYITGIKILNTLHNGDVICYNFEDAINIVPETQRTHGFVISFCEIYDPVKDIVGWSMYQFAGDDLNNWEDKTKWNTIYSQDTNKKYNYVVTNDSVIDVNIENDILNG